MFHLLIDTCVWLELAKDPAQQPLLVTLEHLIAQKQVVLIVPRTIIDEFARNRARVVAESKRSLASVLKRTKDAVSRFGDAKQKRKILDHLNELDHKLPQLDDTATNSVSRIEKLFAISTAIETTDSVLHRAARRAVEGRAPIHRGKNSMNDAILIETYSDYTNGQHPGGERFAFISHNTKDFSQTQGDERVPHPDIAAMFSRIRSLYQISLAATLRRVAPEHLEDAVFQEEYQSEPRRLGEILEAIDELFDKVWYNRHLGLYYGVESGQIEVVDGPYDYRDQNKVTREIYKGARRAARQVEKKRGVKNLGPWTDFEWGMINGKLSALRWMLGDDWDMLDT